MKSELMRLPKEDLVKNALSMRSKAARMKKNAETFSEKLVFAGAGGVSALVMGYVMGGKEREYNKLVAEKGEEAAKAEDPRTIMGVPLDAAVGGGLWLVGLTGLPGKKVSPMFEAAGFGALAGFLHNWGAEMALTATEEAAV